MCMRLTRNAVGRLVQVIESLAAMICDCDVDANVTKLFCQHSLIDKVVFDDKDVQVCGNDLAVGQQA